MATRVGTIERPRSGLRRGSARAFTLIDVLVSIAVIAVLISILLPSLSKVTETARRVVCQSNVRQIGLGLVMCADQNDGNLPPSIFLPLDSPARGPAEPQNMLTIHVQPYMVPSGHTRWDGMGLLYEQGFLPSGKIFYCPSHRGENPYSRYAPDWDNQVAEIVANYHYRGAGPIGGAAAPVDPMLRAMTRNLYRIDPAQSSLLADGMRVQSDINHAVGSNFFRADLTVRWYDDPRARLSEQLPESKADATAEPVAEAWSWFDQAAIGPP